MPYNETLADRIREIISLTHEHVEEKKMFGGLCFMVDDKMSMGVIKDSLMVRLAPEKAGEVLETEDCRPMDFTGKPMKGFIYVDLANLDTQKKVEFWVGLALEYNKVAPVPKKKKG
jgi:hypothetical protein